MCGIAGAYLVDANAARAAVERMTAQMLARGPDDGGVELLVASECAVALGSRRLAIIDVSPSGHQPMSDPERGTTIVYNGMLYNYATLRDELIRAGERFASQCDTEVILKAYGRYGRECVNHLRGMFAFAIYDTRRHELLLARDRLGIKPLYFWRQGSCFLFASQVRALLASGEIAPRLSLDAIQSYLSFGAISEPLTAIEGVQALPAAHVAVLRRGCLDVHRYWTPPEVESETIGREDAARELRRRLDAVVREHLVTDVPLGVFLSGGLDSSALVMVAAQFTDTLRTLSVVFEEGEFSEDRYASLVARRAGSDHVRVLLRPTALLSDLGPALAAMDQPTFDGINTFVVSKAAAETGLRVAVSGLGSDELFDGYGNVRRAAILDRLRRLPPSLAGVAARAGERLMRGNQAAKLRAWLVERPDEPACQFLRRNFLMPEIRRLLRNPSEARLPAVAPGMRRQDRFHDTSILEMDTYMKNILLRDTDMMSMANSLEVRVPFLDHSLVEWVLRLPGSVKSGRGKPLLVAATGDLLPPEIAARAKRGFALPLSTWMRSPMRAEIDETLRRPPSLLNGMIDQQAALDTWHAFLHGNGHWLRPWSLFALFRWCRALEGAAS